MKISAHVIVLQLHGRKFLVEVRVIHLKKWLKGDRGASKVACFLLNRSSLQPIPVNMIAYGSRIKGYCRHIREILAFKLNFQYTKCIVMNDKHLRTIKRGGRIT